MVLIYSNYTTRTHTSVSDDGMGVKITTQQKDNRYTIINILCDPQAEKLFNDVTMIVYALTLFDHIHTLNG
jgi:hypothetical protein